MEIDVKREETSLRSLLKRALRRVCMFIFSIVAGLYVFLLIIAVFFSNSIIFPAPKPSYKLTTEYEKIASTDGNVIAAKELKSDKFDNYAIIDKVDCPIFFIHGKRDRIIPFFHGKALFEKAKPPKSHYWLDTAGHNDVEYTNETEYWNRIKEFIRNRE